MQLINKGPQKLLTIIEEDLMERSNFSLNDEDKQNQFKNSVNNNDVIDLQKKLDETIMKLDKGNI